MNARGMAEDEPASFPFSTSHKNLSWRAGRLHGLDISHGLSVMSLETSTGSTFRMVESKIWSVPSNFLVLWL